jgi:hypothetical protein
VVSALGIGHQVVLSDQMLQQETRLQVPRNVALSMGDLPGIAFKALAGLLRQFRARTEQRNRRPQSWHKGR